MNRSATKLDKSGSSPHTRETGSSLHEDATGHHVLIPGSVYLLRAKSAGAILRISLKTRDKQCRAGLPTEFVSDFYFIADETVEITFPKEVVFECISSGFTAYFRRAHIYGRSSRHKAKHTQLRFFGFGLTVYPYSKDRDAMKAFGVSLATLRSLDLDPGQYFGSEHAFMVDGRMDHHQRVPASIPHRKILRTAVLLHLHYTDLWPEFASILDSLSEHFTLIVTLTTEDPALSRDIRSRFPGAVIFVVPNFGRDIGPFLNLLESGTFDDFDIVCKLHGKKSIRDGKETLLGDYWRRRLILGLIGSADCFRNVLDAFGREPSLGMLGVDAFRLPNARFPEEAAWGKNQEHTLIIAKRLKGSESVPFRLDFFAGTMFWFRPAALAPLRGTGLHHEVNFGKEKARTDGAPEHCIERLFPYAARCAGFRIGTVASEFSASANRVQD